MFADLFYEWQDAADATAYPRNGDAPGEPSGTTGRRSVARAPKPPKQPYAVRMTDDAPFAFGGLWEAWQNPGADGDAAEAWVPTCTLITTAPNALMRRIHDRMPVIVPREQYARWLAPALPPAEARAMLVPYAPELMRAYPVTRAVNDPRHDDPALLAPLVDGRLRRVRNVRPWPRHRQVAARRCLGRGLLTAAFRAAASAPPAGTPQEVPNDPLQNPRALAAVGALR